MHQILNISEHLQAQPLIHPDLSHLSATVPSVPYHAPPGRAAAATRPFGSLAFSSKPRGPWRNRFRSSPSSVSVGVARSDGSGSETKHGCYGCYCCSSVRSSVRCSSENIVGVFYSVRCSSCVYGLSYSGLMLCVEHLV